jgi:hypothetical protein
LQSAFDDAKAAFDAAVVAKAATDQKAKEAARAAVASEYKNASEEREYAKIEVDDFKENIEDWDNTGVEGLNPDQRADFDALVETFNEADTRY